MALMMSGGGDGGGGGGGGGGSSMMGLFGPILGAIAGSQPDHSGGNSWQQSYLNMRDFSGNNILQGASDLEAAAYKGDLSNFNSLQDLTNQGPGAAEVSANNQFQNSFANQLQGLLNQVANPNNPQNIAQNFGQAQALFAPQQTALNQSFQQQGWQNDQLAARLGRSGNDPILRNKLAQSQTLQQNQLNSQIGSYAQQLPMITAQNVMNVGGQLSNIRGGLATQAFQNRQNLMAMGQQLTDSERNYRVGTAQRMSANDSNQYGANGGGTNALAGGIKGFMAGSGSGGGGIGALASAFGG